MRSDYVQEGRVADISADMLHTDYYISAGKGYQRKVNRAKVNKIKREFNPKKVGCILVSLRSSGEYYIIDGNHRTTALRELFGDTVPVKSIILENLSFEDECYLFSSQDDNKSRVKAFDKFNSELSEKNEEAVAIKSLLDDLGLSIDYRRCKEGYICCVTALQESYKKYGEKILRQALLILKASWDDKEHCYENKIVQGLVRFCAGYDGELDNAVAITAFKKVSPDTILINAQKSNFGSGRVGKVAFELFNQYNTAPKSKRLGIKDIF